LSVFSLKQIEWTTSEQHPCAIFSSTPAYKDPLFFPPQDLKVV
jgi:hypothetical protein